MVCRDVHVNMTLPDSLKGKSYIHKHFLMLQTFKRD